MQFNPDYILRAEEVRQVAAPALGLGWEGLAILIFFWIRLDKRSSQ